MHRVCALKASMTVSSIPIRSPDMLSISHKCAITFFLTKLLWLFLITKLLWLMLTCGYTWLLPKFHTAHLTQTISILVLCICFLPLFSVCSVSTTITIFNGIMRDCWQVLRCPCNQLNQSLHPNTCLCPCPRDWACHQEEVLHPHVWGVLVWYTTGFNMCGQCPDKSTAVTYVVTNIHPGNSPKHPWALFWGPFLPG